MTKIEFEKSYEDVQDTMFRFAYKLTKSESAANDLLQETALKAYTKRKSFSRKSPFKSWFSTILYNNFINEYRKRTNRTKLENHVRTIKNLLPNPNQRNNGYLKLVKEDIEKEISSVGPKCRKAFKMFIEGYQYKEISDKLNIPTGTVKSRINYARQIAKRRITNLGLYAQGA